MGFSLQRKYLPSAICILFFIQLSACKRGDHDVPASPEIITMVGVDMATGKCIMKDINGKSADTFKITAGKKIQWIVQTTAIKDVTKVFKKPTSQDVFSELPHRVGNSTTWEGTIAASASGLEEEYNINWTDQAGLTYIFDPKIQVR